MKFTPGPGVGGHCIPIDPNYLSYEVRNKLGYPFRFVELAQKINNSMPRYVVDRATELLNEYRKPLNGSDVLILGVTYKADIADQAANILRRCPSPSCCASEGRTSASTTRWSTPGAWRAAPLPASWICTRP